MGQDSTVYKVKQVAELLGLSQACIRKWIASRRIGYVRLGRAIRIPTSESERLLAEGAVPAREPRNGR